MEFFGPSFIKDLWSDFLNPTCPNNFKACDHRASQHNETGCTFITEEENLNYATGITTFRRISCECKLSPEEVRLNRRLMAQRAAAAYEKEIQDPIDQE